jgi:steroid delta-isomerase-like uncharacterized protein
MNSLKIISLSCILFFFVTLMTDLALAQQTKADTTIKHLMNQNFEAWSTNKPELIDEIFAEDGIYEDVAADYEAEGKDQIKNLIKSTLAAIPNFKVKLIQWFSSDNKLACQWIMTGTQTGDFPELKASGKSFSVSGASVAVIKDGKFVRWSDYYDMYTFLKQLGVIPDQDSNDKN